MFLAGSPPALPTKSDNTPENLPTISDPMPNLEKDGVRPRLIPDRSGHCAKILRGFHIRIRSGNQLGECTKIHAAQFLLRKGEYGPGSTLSLISGHIQLACERRNQRIESVPWTAFARNRITSWS